MFDKFWLKSNMKTIANKQQLQNAINCVVKSFEIKSDRDSKKKLPHEVEMVSQFPPVKPW